MDLPMPIPPEPAFLHQDVQTFRFARWLQLRRQVKLARPLDLHNSLRSTALDVATALCAWKLHVCVVLPNAVQVQLCAWSGRVAREADASDRERKAPPSRL